MIKYQTPTGTGEAITEEQAIEVCKDQACEEMERNGTGIYRTFCYNGITKIQTGTSIWLVEGKSQYQYL